MATDMCKIEIDITYIPQDGSTKFSPIERINRIVRVDGQEVYNETTDWKIYFAFEAHPIRQLERFILGLEKSENANDACPSAAKRFASSRKSG